ncbi:ribose 5-phosphate isomerase B [Aeromicrobium panaciterrae]|uniref:Ribose-5-phosphate isomerase B n=1 Tax=Aeromicrobium panaciterrae TaxID=363861 RepID=A0ABU1UMT9_9ACTN|nr:ribose-5-phosphate isomerase [Aeromicrobium panaciterrae]MDR7086492.1 ribose 5-phosphate isomerase B [Aeromicrobium panaciterrae]
MRVHIAADHAGFELKTHLIDWLNANGHDVVDHGAHEYDADDDYPPFCVDAAAAAVADPSSLAIVIGGSGNGEQIAANKVKGARAALAWSVETAALARQHNNAQIVSVGARMHTADEATAIVESFLTTPWSDEARHQRRIDLLLTYEETGQFA